MRVYVDTSVVLRVLFREPNALPEWGQWTEAYASRLWFTEALRTLDRLRLLGAINDEQVAQRRRDIELVHSVLHIVPVSESILHRAGEAYSTVIGTLDAIHLATAIHVRDSGGLDALLTHDVQLATAATASGLLVRGT
ncbi:MAG: type II toxin-antitoxin system VapC family toxin [bacterium]